MQQQNRQPRKYRKVNFDVPEPSGPNGATIFEFAAKTFSAERSAEGTLTYAFLVLFRKHLHYHLSKERYSASSPSRFDEGPDRALFREKSERLAHVLGLDGFVDVDDRLLRLLRRLWTLNVPRTVLLRSEDFDELVESARLSASEVETLWLKDVETCDCPIESRRHDLLKRAFVSVYVDKAAREGNYTAAQIKAMVGAVSERDVRIGMLKLAMETWSLDYDVGRYGGDGADENLGRGALSGKDFEEAFGRDGRASAPKTMRILVDENGRPFVVVPSRTEGEGDEDEEGLDFETGIPERHAEHPYSRMKLNLLVKEKGYPLEAANDVVRWSLIPSNCAMPFPLMLRMLRGYNDDSDRF